MNCDECRQALEEHFAVAGMSALVPVWCERHLGECEECRLFVAEERELNRLLEEPLALPPADLAERVMGAIKKDKVEVGVPLGERLLWAAAGGGCVAAFQWVRFDAVMELMSYDFSWTLPSLSFTLPDTGPFLLPAAALLTVLQAGTLVWVRKRGMAA